MKKYIERFSFCLILALATISCNPTNLDEGGNGNEKTGKVSFSIKPEGDFVLVEGVDVKSSESKGDSESKASTSKADNEDTQNYKVVIYNSENEIVQSWDKASDIPAIMSMPTGDYTIEAKSTDLQAAAWDAKYYYGKQAFSVIYDKTTSVEVKCTLQNMKVTVEYSDSFLRNFKDFTVSVEILDTGVVPEGENYKLDFKSTTTSAGYFMVTPLLVTINGIRLDDSEYTHTETITEVHPMDYHRIKLNINEIGSTGLSIIVDTETINIEHDFTVPTDDEDLGLGGDTETPGQGGSDVDNPDQGGEDPDNPDQVGGDPIEPEVVLPTITGEGFDIDSPVIIRDADIVYDEEAGGNISLIPVKMNLTAEEGGIQSLVVKMAMSSDMQPLVESMFGGDSFDLCNMSTQIRGVVEALGLIAPGTDVKNMTSFQFDLTPFMGLLMEGTHNFTVTITDAKNNTVSKTLSIQRVQ